MAEGIFEGRVALVTGASRGIGLATARDLCARGAKVAMLARGAEELATAAAELGDSALAIPTDVSVASQVEAAVSQVLERWGRLDILVNNAAIGRIHRIEDASDEDLTLQVGVNVLGPLYTIRASVPHLRAAGGGDIVNVSSDSVERPFAYLVTYAATKGALETLSQGLREELAPEGIRVILVRSGPALTSFAANWEPEAAGRAFAQWEVDARLDPTCVVAPETVASAIAGALSQPREATVHFVDIRPTRGKS